MKNKRQKIMSMLKRTHVKRTWQAGIVGILSIHLSQLVRSMTPSLFTIVSQVIAWSAGITLVWYQWMNHEYTQQWKQSYHTMATALSHIHDNDKSAAWILEKNGVWLGTALLKYEDEEGRLWYLLNDPKHEPSLVREVFRFARENKIKTLNLFNDCRPLHHLFSPTSLSHDLYYVDRTYYPNGLPSSDNQDSSGAQDKQHQISLLTRLTILDLSHNKLQDIPDCIDQLKNLTHFKLSHNNLTDLPESIWNLSKLTYLDISYTGITEISGKIGTLVQLSMLDVSATEIKAVPAELLRLSRINIKTDYCSNLFERSMETTVCAKNDPPTLTEICARMVSKPILHDLMHLKKKKLARSMEIHKAMLSPLPIHLKYYLTSSSPCSACGGPYFTSYQIRYQIVEKGDDSYLPVEHKLCMAHWSSEADRLLYLFTNKSANSLPPLKKSQEMASFILEPSELACI
ncbi:hypothetical protein BDB01DRAFT_842491 [Pilobolus umbonatus]|nr:hypothetical protein BDB01DRAFT_842491 [Pilobolus umbonatus]